MKRWIVATLLGSLLAACATPVVYRYSYDDGYYRGPYRYYSYDRYSYYDRSGHYDDRYGYYDRYSMYNDHGK